MTEEVLHWVVPSCLIVRYLNLNETLYWIKHINLLTNHWKSIEKCKIMVMDGIINYLKEFPGWNKGGCSWSPQCQLQIVLPSWRFQSPAITWIFSPSSLKERTEKPWWRKFLIKLHFDWTNEIWTIIPPHHWSITPEIEWHMYNYRIQNMYRFKIPVSTTK